MKAIAIILISLLSVSCMTVKRIERNCDLFAKICITETQRDTVTKTVIKTEIIYRDTTIYVKVPGKEVIKEVPVYIEKGIVNSELSILNVPFARSTAQVINSIQRHELVQTDTVMRVKLENALKTVKRQEKHIKVLSEKYLVEIEVNSPFANFAIKVFWGLIVIVVLGMAYLIFKNRIKILGLLKKIK